MACNCGGTAKSKPAKPKKVAPKKVAPKKGKAVITAKAEEQKAASTGGTPKPSPNPSPKAAPKPNPCFCNGGKQVKPPAGYTKALNARMDRIAAKANSLARKG